MLNFSQEKIVICQIPQGVPQMLKCYDQITTMPPQP